MTREQVKEAADKSWGQDIKQSSYQVGDVVEYLPHVCHAFNCNANNEYPWVIGERKNPRYERDPVTGEEKLVEDVVELDEGKMHRNVLPFLQHLPNPKEERQRYVPLRPKRPWKALVTKVNPDGTVDLDVESNVGSGMLTLHYKSIAVDETGQVPHTCRKKKGGQ